MQILLFKGYNSLPSNSSGAAGHIQRILSCWSVTLPGDQERAAKSKVRLSNLQGKRVGKTSSWEASSATVRVV
jgi:hypothetical protein